MAKNEAILPVAFQLYWRRNLKCWRIGEGRRSKAKKRPDGEMICPALKLPQESGSFALELLYQKQYAKCGACFMIEAPKTRLPNPAEKIYQKISLTKCMLESLPC
jgi:hypothetical protein